MFCDIQEHMMKNLITEFTQAARDARDELKQFAAEHPLTTKATLRGVAVTFAAAVALGLGNGVYQMQKNPAEFTQYAVAEQKINHFQTLSPAEAAVHAKVSSEQKPFIMAATLLSSLAGVAGAATALRRRRPEALIANR